jgi:hypothetical protein
VSEWQRYSSLMRQLAVERSAEKGRLAEREKDLDAIAGELAEFRNRVTEHVGKLNELADWLRIPHPDLHGRPDTEIPDQATNRDYVERGEKALERAAVHARRAARRATKPRVLPFLPAAVRNFAVYAVLAVLTVVVDLAFLSGRDVSLSELSAGKHWELATAITTLVIFPVLAFALGYVACGFLGAPRVKQGPVERSYPIGMAILLCAFPVVLIVSAIQHTS